MRTRLSISAAALGLALSGCGGSDTTTTTTRTVNDATVESGIKQDLSSSGTTVTKVTCPNDVPVQAGATFTCTVSWNNGATGKVKVTQKGAGRYAYEPVSGSVVIPGATVDQQLEAQLAKQGAPNAAVTCPDNIVVKTGTTVTCDVAGGGGKAAGTVTFSFSTADGEIDPSSVQAG